MRPLPSLMIITAGMLSSLPGRTADAMTWYGGGVSDVGYIAVKGGVTRAQGMTPDTLVGPMDFSTDSSWTGAVVLGNRFNSYLRGELEASYAQSNVKDATLAGFSIADAGGKLRTIAGMGNMYLDLLPGCRLQPFVGAGIGAANVKLDKYKASGVTLVNDDDSALAWQAMAGLRYQLTPLLAATLEYRYFSTAGLDIESTSGERSSVDYRSHNGLAGLQLQF